MLDRSATQHLARILLRPSADPSDMMDDFTAFEVHPPRAAEGDLPSYRAITNDDAEEGAEEDEEALALQIALGPVSTLEDDLRMRRVETEAHLRAHPDDVSRWIEYSTLHLKASHETSDSSAFVDPAKQPTTLASAEVTLSMLARALEADPGNFTSPELHLAYLRAAEVFWPQDKVAERWRNVLRELENRGVPEEDMMGLYLGYIGWREGQGFTQAVDGMVGGVDEVVEVYTQCLENLRTSEGKRREHWPPF